MSNLNQLVIAMAQSPQGQAMYAKNAVQMAEMAKIAKSTGKKYRGATAEYWEQKAQLYTRLSKGDISSL
jgi:hypothetical protein